MTIVQKFYVEYGGNLLEFTRDEAELLYADLGDALGENSITVGLAEDLQTIISQLNQLYALVQDVSRSRMYPGMEEPVEIGGQDVQTMDVDAYLARQQAMAQVPASPAGGRNPGSGIGNLHT